MKILHLVFNDCDTILLDLINPDIKMISIGENNEIVGAYVLTLEFNKPIYSDISVYNIGAVELAPLKELHANLLTWISSSKISDITVHLDVYDKTKDSHRINYNHSKLTSFIKAS